MSQSLAQGQRYKRLDGWGGAPVHFARKMRAFRIVVFFTWLAGVYAFKFLAPIFVAAYAVRKARRYARARGLKQD